MMFKIKRGLRTVNNNASNCNTCSHYIYDEDYECYTCSEDLDEDEMARFLADSFRDCPFYSYDNEYEIVRHQM